LSHLFLYAPGPGGSVVLAEVRVWGEGNEVSHAHQANRLEGGTCGIMWLPHTA
jgi:hypothetical protein